LAGSDKLYGAGSPHTFDGGPGNDYILVDSAGDRVIEAVGGGYDTVFTTVTYALQAGMEIEALAVYDKLSTNYIELTGNEFNNILVGNEGSNVFRGGGGADQFYGGGGADYYFVDSPDDRVFEYGPGVAGGDISSPGGDGADVVWTSVSYTLQAGTSVEGFGAYSSSSTNQMDLTGNEFSQSIVGNNASNVINGMGGADKMEGYGGNDYYVVDNQGDRVVEYDGQGYDIVFATTSFTLAGFNNLSAIESLGAYDQASTAALDLTGNKYAQRIVGSAGANVLDGKGGADVLFGEGGDDTFAFTSALGNGNVDYMPDFQSGSDKIALDHKIFTGLAAGALPDSAFLIGTATLHAEDRIIYNQAIGSLLYDADGSGPGSAIQFATVQPGTEIKLSDFVVI
jgi:Ca2+-binding RTX toxin-like protein